MNIIERRILIPLFHPDFGSRYEMIRVDAVVAIKVWFRICPGSRLEWRFWCVWGHRKADCLSVCNGIGGTFSSEWLQMLQETFSVQASSCAFHHTSAASSKDHTSTNDTSCLVPIQRTQESSSRFGLKYFIDYVDGYKYAFVSMWTFSSIYWFLESLREHVEE